MVRGFSAFIIGSVFGFLVVPTLLSGVKAWMQKTGASTGAGSPLSQFLGPPAKGWGYDY